MQFNSVYLYSNKVDVFTNLDSWPTERYRKVYQRNFKIYRGIDNRIDLQVRNSDEKAKDITGYTLVFNLVERGSQKLVLEKECSIVSAVNGKFFVTLTELEMIDIIKGFYDFSVYTVSGSGTKQLLYIDSQYGATGTIEVLGDIAGEPRESTVIDTFGIVPTFWPNDGTSKSELVYSSPEFSSSNTTHTFKFYETDYKGTVKIEASIETSSSPNSGKWVTLASVDFPGSTEYKVVEGKWNWFRIKHLPTVGRFEVYFASNKAYRLRLDRGGEGYSVGNTFTFPGSVFNGVDGVNDLVITVTEVSDIGAIIAYTSTGISNYRNAEQSKTISLGSLDKVLYR